MLNDIIAYVQPSRINDSFLYFTNNSLYFALRSKINVKIPPITITPRTKSSFRVVNKGSILISFHIPEILIIVSAVRIAILSNRWL